MSAGRCQVLLTPNPPPRAFPGFPRACGAEATPGDRCGASGGTSVGRRGARPGWGSHAAAAARFAGARSVGFSAPGTRAGPSRRSRPRRGKEFPAHSPWSHFLSPLPRRLPPLSRDAARPRTSCRRGSVPGPMQSRLLLLGAPGGPGVAASRRVRLLLWQLMRSRPGGDGRPEVRLLHAGAGADSGNPAPRRPRAPRSPAASLRTEGALAAQEPLPLQAASRGPGARTLWVSFCNPEDLMT